jgi:hypothetical protein
MAMGAYIDALDAFPCLSYGEAASHLLTKSISGDYAARGAYVIYLLNWEGTPEFGDEQFNELFTAAMQGIDEAVLDLIEHSLDHLNDKISPDLDQRLIALIADRNPRDLPQLASRE